MFIAALLTIAKTWKQQKRPSTNEWIKIWGVYVCVCEYYSAIKRNEIMLFEATLVILEIIIPSEGSKSEKEKYHMISLICGILKNYTDELMYKTEIDPQV